MPTGSEVRRAGICAVNLKNFLKGDARVDAVAKDVADHYVQNVEPLGYKAFLVAVDRPACAKYKAALDVVVGEVGDYCACHSLSRAELVRVAIRNMIDAKSCLSYL